MSSAPFTFTRTIFAPRDRVWAAYTEAAHLGKWWGTKGVTTHIAHLDLRPGGTFFYSMKPPGDIPAMWGRWTFREIVAPERLDTLVCFTDSEGNPIRHPFSSTWPMTTQSALHFAEQDDQTLLTLTWAPYEATEEECRTFAASHDGMRQGLAGTFDLLEEYVTHLKA